MDVVRQIIQFLFSRYMQSAAEILNLNTQVHVALLEFLISQH